VLDARVRDWRIILRNDTQRARTFIFRYSLLVLLVCFCGGWSQATLQKRQPPPRSTAGLNAAQPPAAADSTTQTAVETKPQVDALGRTSPHGCVLGFLHAAETKNYEKAAEYFDGKRSPKEAEEIVVQLKYLLDQGLSTSIDDLSRSPSGNTDDQLRLSREQVGTVKTPSGELKVLLDLVKRPDQPPIWLFSQETLNQVPAAYSSSHHTDYERFFPVWTRTQIFSMPLWRWGLVFGSVILTFVFAILITRLTLRLLTSIVRARLSVGVERSVLALKLPIFGLILALGDAMAGGYAITALGRHYWKNAGLLLGWVSTAWLLVRITDILMNLSSHRLLQQLQVERATFVTLLGRLFKIFVGIILIFALLTHAGVNVSALVAGLGIGGIALALAAQKTLADLFGGLSIVMRGAVRVGDFCQIAGVTGTVEDIGISAVNLRTLDRSVVSMPNAKVAEVGLENFSLRDQFLLHQIFTLRFDTSHEVVEVVLDGIVQNLSSHPHIDNNTARARLIDLSTAGPRIEILAYFRKQGADWAEFLSHQEELLLKIMSVMANAGVSLAPPVVFEQKETRPEKKRH
jgi:MscS family membrane protein